MSYFGAKQALADAERDLARAIMLHLLAVLENGEYLGHPTWMFLLGQETLERLRVLRKQVCERDVYELLYGELPSGIVDPEFRGDPWAQPDPAGTG